MNLDHLHEYDLQLCAYAVDNVAQHMGRPHFSRRVEKILAGRPLLLDYIKKSADTGIDAEDVRLLLDDGELMSLAGAVEGDLDLPWQPDPGLHRRHVETVKEVSDHLTRQASEDWSEECAGFGRQLDAERVRLTEGIDVVRQWVRRLRYLLRVMGATDLLPRPEGRSPTPTHPEPPPDSISVSPAPVRASGTTGAPPTVLDIKDDETVRPANPTRAYCLLPPNVVRWDTEVEVQQRLWHLLGVLLDEPLPAQAEDIEELASPYKQRNEKCLRNDVSALNNALAKIKWPITYRCKGGFVTADC